MIVRDTLLPVTVDGSTAAAGPSQAAQPGVPARLHSNAPHSQHPAHAQLSKSEARPSYADCVAFGFMEQLDGDCAMASRGRVSRRTTEDAGGNRCPIVQLRSWMQGCSAEGGRLHVLPTPLREPAAAMAAMVSFPPDHVLQKNCCAAALA